MNKLNPNMASMNGGQSQKKKVPLNPFVSTLKLNVYDWIKCILLTILLLPIRVILIVLCFFIAYFLSLLGTVGLSDEELTQKPMRGWRRSLTCWMTTVCRLLYWFFGLRVRIIGRHASRSEAPILVVAPHSSFLDSFVAMWTGIPSPVAAIALRKMPLIGRMIDYTQPVYVQREDPESRKNTIEEIVRRSWSPEVDWRQIMIFPEGTTTNGKCLANFKSGAFIPGVAVQPVCLRFPNRLNTLNWSWGGPGSWYLLWASLTQFVTYCEIEFLPVYVPTEEEKSDARLFANNVRDVMAKALVDLPVTNYTYDDYLLMKRAEGYGLPLTVGLIEVEEIRREFGVEFSVVIEEIFASFFRLANRALGTADISEFASYIHLPADHQLVIQLFSLYDPDRTGVITFKNYAR